MKFLTSKSRPDNFLLEMELAVKANRNNTLAIYPLLVGTAQSDGTYAKFDATIFRLEHIPDKASPTSSRSPKSTLSALFKFQGIWMQSKHPSVEDIKDIVKWCDEFAWSKASANSIKVGDVVSLFVVSDGLAA